jgi:UDP-N-acetylglucosamine enolpyruvyl transferase
LVLNAIADGSSGFRDIFENRFMHVNELVRLGAKISWKEVRRHRGVEGLAPP